MVAWWWIPLSWALLWTVATVAAVVYVAGKRVQARLKMHRELAKITNPTEI